MEFEAFKKEVDKNIESLFNKANNDEKALLNIMINTINDLCKEKQELIEYLKEKMNNFKLKGCNYEKTYICGKTTAYEEILSKIEKE